MAAALLGLPLLATGAAVAADGGLGVASPWIRLIMSSRPAAGYFTLTNAGDKARTLVGAASPDCGSLMLHRSMSSGGVDQMAPVASVPVPAHGALSFAPGGYHLMCMQPSAAMKPGSSAAVTLKFADGSTLTRDFAVRGPTGK